MYFCSLCEIPYKEKEEYITHIKCKEHLDNRLLYDKKNKDDNDEYICYLCDKEKFYNINDLVEHVELGSCYMKLEELPGYPNNINFERLYKLEKQSNTYYKDLYNKVSNDKRYYKRKLNKIKNFCNMLNEDI